MNSENTIELSRNDSDGSGSATVSVALVGVSPASPTMILPPLLVAGPKDGRVFGETPKMAVETTALPKATSPFRLTKAAHAGTERGGNREEARQGNPRDP